MFLNRSKLGVGCVPIWFLENWGQISNLSRMIPLFIRMKGDAVWIYGLDKSNDILSLAVLISGIDALLEMSCRN